MRWWKQFEFELSKNGERVARSGAGEFEKLDLRLGDFLGDAKTSQQEVKAGKSFRITKREWENAGQKARWEGKLPLMVNQLDEYRLATIDFDDFCALQTELEELRAAARRPRLSKDDQALLQIPETESHWFRRIDEHWQMEQASLKGEWKWSGRISPSAKIHLRMCMEKFFSPENLKFVEMGGQTLRSARLGTALHRGLFEYVENVDHLLFPFPEFGGVGGNLFLQNRFNQIKPEVPVDCEETGIRGHIDQIIALPRSGTYPDIKIENPLLTWNSPYLHYYQPVVFDLKTTPRSAKDWTKFCKRGVPLPTHKGQVLLYMYMLRKYKDLYFKDFPVEIGGVGYLNPKMDWFSPNSYVEFYFEYEPYAEMLEILVQNLSEQRSRHMSGKRIFCTYDYCSDHGSK